MKVQKRNGDFEEVSFDKILTRIRLLCESEEFKEKLHIDPTAIAQKVVNELYDGITTTKLDELSYQSAIATYSKHPEYAVLASRICVSNHHKHTSDSFAGVIQRLYDADIIQKYLYDLVQNNIDFIELAINYHRDYDIDFFGLKTLEKSYLLKINGIIVERPQHLFMRVALCIHRENITSALDMYDSLSKKEYIHATPTLFNAGTKREQLASCFLLAMKNDSVEGIYDTLKDCALISKYAGGIGIHVHNIRASGSHIHGTNGVGNGLLPMLRVYNETARYIDQGGGKRNGSFAIYLEPWHADIEIFMEMKKNHGNEMERARDLFYALWIPDLFMERIQKNENWTLFCPNECPGLSDVHSDEFVKLYTKYESEGKGRKTVSAQKLWFAMLTSQIETGTPYMVYKDSCNRKSNQKNLGTIKSSNLCAEIIEYSSSDEIAVCNLASISLPSCLEEKDVSELKLTIYTKSNCCFCRYAKQLCDSKNISYTEKKHTDIVIGLEEPVGVSFPKIFKNGNEPIGGFDKLCQFLSPTMNYQKLSKLASDLTVNLNHVIDYNFYPIPETRKSNLRHRPMGIGVQGLADVFYRMNVAFDSEEAKEINKKIFESIYYGSLRSSMEIAKHREEGMKILQTGMSQYSDEGVFEFLSQDVLHKLRKELKPMEEELNRDKYLGSYSSYIGSPMFHGELQQDLWNVPVDDSLHDWNTLREDIQKYGVRNSLLVALMPTASSSQILGNLECFEPAMSNIYSRRTLAGEFMVLNEYLVKELMIYDLWSPEMKDKIILYDGSVQGVEGIPRFICDKYKTSWELKMKDVIDMSADRSPFICQSQSLNLFQEAPNFKTLSSMHFYAWKKGLKTGIYYLRSRPSSRAIQFTISPETDCESCSA
jgi:ribonucleoside-diphosphate reductase subunit M1